MTSGITICGVDARDDFRAVASITVSNGVASVRAARASSDAKVAPMLDELISSRARARYASVLHASAYDTMVVKIPATVRADDELSLAEHKVRDAARPAAPRKTIAKRSAPTLLSVHFASAIAVAERETHAPNAVVIDAASAWNEVAPDAVIDMGHDGSSAALYVQSRSTVPFVKPLPVLPSEDLAEMVINHLGNARSSFDARAQSIKYSGRDLGLFEALLPHCDRLGFSLSLVNISSYVNPPWALAAACAVAAARMQG